MLTNERFKAQDDLLIQKAKTGDTKATEELFARFEPMFKRILRKYQIREYEKDDIRSIANVSFLEAIRDYNGTAPFAYFVKMRVYSDIFNLISVTKTRRRREVPFICINARGEEYNFLENCLSFFDRKFEQIEENIDNPLLFAIRLSNALALQKFGLTKRQVTILIMLREGYKCVEIAKHINLNSEYVQLQTRTLIAQLKNLANSN